MHHIHKFLRKERRSDSPGEGKRFLFFGAFKKKEDAMLKEGEAPGRFIEEREIRGQKRYVVMQHK